MIMFKLSKYNYYKQVDKSFYIYNMLYRSFVCLPDELWVEMECGNFDVLNDKEKKYLLNNGIILNEQVNERYVFKDIMSSNCLQNKRMVVFFAMTSLCNLACPYCYQDCRREKIDKEYISKDNIDQFVSFVEKSQASNIDMIYFGGEPTINQENLIYAIRQLNSLTNKNITNFIITNGYNISDDLIETVKSISSFGLQVTLDGNKSLHDKIKTTKDGKGSFDRILRNVEKIITTTGKKVNIRVNVSSVELDSFFLLVDEIHSRFGNNVNLHFETIFDGQKTHNCNGPENVMDISDLLQYAFDKGYYTTPSVEFAPCVANLRNSFALDENLKIYPCPSQLYDKTVGYISDGQLYITDNEWYENIYDIPECVYNCAYGSLCYGGCNMFKKKCRKELLDKLLPYVIDRKIEQYRIRKSRERV